VHVKASQESICISHYDNGKWQNKITRNGYELNQFHSVLFVAAAAAVSCFSFAAIIH
jgi:hypothetical protein